MTGERLEDPGPLTLKTEEGAISQGMGASLERDPSPRASGRNQRCRHLDFRTCDLQNGKRINLRCSMPPGLWSFVAAATGDELGHTTRDVAELVCSPGMAPAQLLPAMAAVGKWPSLGRKLSRSCSAACL